MPVIFKLAQKEKYTWSWPEQAPNGDGILAEVPEENRIQFNMRLLSEPDTEEIENKQFRTHLTQDQARQARAGTQGDNKNGDAELELSLHSGTMRRIKIKRAVLGWSNILNESNTEIPFSHENLFKVMRGNAGFESDDDGKPNLADDLIAHIDERNSLTKNPQRLRASSQ